MVLRRNGTAYTRMVLEAYYQERITLSKVADYLDIHLKSLAKVERAAFSGLALERAVIDSLMAIVAFAESVHVDRNCPVHYPQPFAPC